MIITIILVNIHYLIQTQYKEMGEIFLKILFVMRMLRIYSLVSFIDIIPHPHSPFISQFWYHSRGEAFNIFWEVVLVASGRNQVWFIKQKRLLHGSWNFRALTWLWNLTWLKLLQLPAFLLNPIQEPDYPTSVAAKDWVPWRRNSSVGWRASYSPFTNLPETKLISVSQL